MLELQREVDMGILFITHDLGVIAELADSVLVMYKGKIVEQGLVMDIFANPQHPYTKGLLACRPPLEKRLHFLPTVCDFMSTDVDGNIVESGKAVKEVIDSLIETKEERIAQHLELYARPKILEVKIYEPIFLLKMECLAEVKIF